MSQPTPHTDSPVFVQYATSRPRVLGWIRSAAILDGDWGTSVAYVLGIAFALAGNASFWHLMAMLAFTSLVAANYITICRLYPDGGGVYSSVSHRSRTVAVIGALLLAADYVITISLSVLEAAHYFGLESPVIGAVTCISLIGALNWLGPRHTGSGAILISGAALLTILMLSASSIPRILSGVMINHPDGSILENWEVFVGIILSISGIEAVSNMTGLMKDPKRDSRRAIGAVLMKVVFATVVLGLAMHAIPGMDRFTHKEEMLRFMGEWYIGPWFGWIVGITIGFLLISAGNTALNDLISIQFLMAVDDQLPLSLRRLNRHGVPFIPLLLGTAAPILVLLFVHDIIALSELYAIGVVGAIMINVSSTATDPSLSIGRLTRVLMTASAIILIFIELSIVINKPKASLFIGVVLILGLSARAIAHRRISTLPAASITQPAGSRLRRQKAIPRIKFLVALKDYHEKLLRFAIDEAKARQAFLIVLHVKEIAVGPLPERLSLETNGLHQKIQSYCADSGISFEFISVPSNEVGYTISEYAATFGVERVIIGVSSRKGLERLFKARTFRSVGELLPDDINLVIFGG